MFLKAIEKMFSHLFLTIRHLQVLFQGENQTGKKQNVEYEKARKLTLL